VNEQLYCAAPKEMLTDCVDSVYGVMRKELWGEALENLQKISYVHSRLTSRPAKFRL
jgi:hypothetical protein